MFFCVKKLYLWTLLLLTAVFVCSCSSTEADMDASQEKNTLEIETVAIATFESIFETTDIEMPKETPHLLRLPEGLPGAMFYIYYPRDVMYSGYHGIIFPWNYVLGEDEAHNAWIDTQTFNSVFYYDDWCLRTGYYNESGQWGVTVFTMNGFEGTYIGCGSTAGQTFSYPDGDYWLVTPNAFGVPNDHSVEITSFDETKQTVTLTFTSPEGETTEVYINYEKQCRCDENGTPLLNENGNTFLYQFEGDFIGTQYHELD